MMFHPTSPDSISSSPSVFFGRVLFGLLLLDHFFEFFFDPVWILDDQFGFSQGFDLGGFSSLVTELVDGPLDLIAPLEHLVLAFGTRVNTMAPFALYSM